MAALYPTKKSYRYPELTAEIKEMFQVRQQTREIYEQKDQWRLEMERIIKEQYPNCRLVLSGSSANGFGSKSSDIDLVMCFDRGTRSVGSETLRRINSLFTRNRRRFETEVIPNARVPIIKLKDREKLFETDISVENWCSLENAFLLRCYSECDPRVKPLVICIKLWAQNARITDAKLKRLAVIHYLQAGCSPPVLPSLQNKFPELFCSSGSAVIDKITDDLPIQTRSYKSDNTQSLGELLIGFFRYFSAFDWSRTISIRLGSTRYTSPGKIWSGPFIRLEDPSDGGNVTRSVFDSYEFSRIKRAFNTALDKLQQKSSLEEIV